MTESHGITQSGSVEESPSLTELQLDGVWKVERASGFLPPLLGVTKRISGERGETRVGPLPGVPFDVEGAVLRYRAPFNGFVDELEPSADGWLGRATFLGREYGTFRLLRQPH
jgi:hypothetical protein